MELIKLKEKKRNEKKEWVVKKDLLVRFFCIRVVSLFSCKEICYKMSF